MRNTRLSKTRDIVWSNMDDLLDALVQEIEDLESANDALQDKIDELEGDLSDLRG